VEEDDIHLIMEYKKGDKWGNYRAPRSNRSDVKLRTCRYLSIGYTALHANFFSCIQKKCHRHCRYH